MHNSKKFREFKRKGRIRYYYLTGAIILIVLLFLIINMPTFLLKDGNKKILAVINSKSLGEIITGKYNTGTVATLDEGVKEKYNVIDLVKYMAIATSETATFTTSSEVPYVIDDGSYDVAIDLTEVDESSKYTIIYGVGQNRTEEEFTGSKVIKFNNLEKEGANEVYVAVKKNENIIENGELNAIVYRVNSYQRQFLEELETKGIGVHVQSIKAKKFLPLYKALGAQYARVSIAMNFVYKNNKFTFSTYNSIINELLNNDVRMLNILSSTSDTLGSDNMISNEEELNLFTEYIKAVSKQYPKIKNYEILNEPNSVYVSDENIFWYGKLIESAYSTLRQQDINNKIIIGVNSYGGGKTVYPTTFMNKLIENGGYRNSNLFSYHLYDFSKTGVLNKQIKNRMNENIDLVNDAGGFLKNANTEFGGSTYTLSPNKDSVTLECQAYKVVQQNIIGDENNVEFSMVYNIKNSGRDIDQKEHNFGLIDSDYNPKLAYYSLKNYYQNTNGAEYIGTVNIADGLEAYVYDKDGKPKIVTWAQDTNNSIKILYKDFTATDMYGNNIEADSDGYITITPAPVYLDNISRNYFYKAISNNIMQKYINFEEQFSSEIDQVNGLREKIETFKQIAQNMKDYSEENEIEENTAIQLMKDHYQLGNELIEKTKNKNLIIENVKLSSMLDRLNDIGNSYEDLITISAKTIRNEDLETMNKKVEETSNIIQNNQDLDIIYPAKILEFSKDYQQETNYINSLDEENGIKTGLIVSKNLHAELLANWSKMFSNIYVDRYIEQNPITYTSSIPETQITNQDVKVTVNKSEDTQITSDNGSNEYTFEQNGTHDFHYVRRGIEDKITATVNNIDKEPPVIAGVEANKMYINKAITPEVKDDHLEKVELYLNDEIVPDYQENTKISIEGKYKIIATDLAENTTEVDFEISNNENAYEVGKSNLIELYDNFNKKYATQVNNSLILESQQIRNSINNTTFYTKADTIINLLNRTLNIGNKLLESDNKENVVQILCDIGNICNNYETILELNEEIIELDVSDVQNKSDELNKLIKDNSDLNIEDLADLIRLFKKYRNDIIYTENYVKKYYYIVAENLSNYINILINNKITQYIEANPITLSYSEDINKLTRNDITVTLNKGEDTKITCNNGSNIYTFNKNGSYVFSYERRGRKGKLEAKVENIDKDSPTIKGVVDGISYTSKRTPRVSDEHLDIVELYFNDEVVENYTLGSTLTEIGKYRIVATDLVGNVTAVDFEIREITDNELIETEYNVDNNFIKGILPNTSYEQFIKNIETTSSYIIKRDGKELSIEETKALATGDILEFPNVNKSYKLIVAGDINKDGNVNAKDLVRMRRYLLGQVEFDEIETCAADANLDGKEVTAKDLVRLRVIILSKES